MSRFSCGFVAAYLATGLFMGAGLARAIPAMSAGGVAYYAAIWPWFIASATYGAPTPPIPRWGFHFRAPKVAS